MGHKVQTPTEREMHAQLPYLKISSGYGIGKGLNQGSLLWPSRLRVKVELLCFNTRE